MPKSGGLGSAVHQPPIIGGPLPGSKGSCLYRTQQPGWPQAALDPLQVGSALKNSRCAGPPHAWGCSRTACFPDYTNAV